MPGKFLPVIALAMLFSTTVFAAAAPAAGMAKEDFLAGLQADPGAAAGVALDQIGMSEPIPLACDIWLRRDYYVCGGGPYCGSTYFRREEFNIVNGCVTSCFIDVRYSCSCQ